MNKSTKVIGDMTEIIIISRLMMKGYSVSIPFGDNQRYDLLVDVEGHIQRVQCKTGKFKFGAVVFKASSTQKSTNKNKAIINGYEGQIDLFGVYCPQLETCYLVPISDVSKGRTSRQTSLRVSKTRNGQSKKIR